MKELIPDLITSYKIGQAVHGITKLGIPDHLDVDVPIAIEELANKTNTNSESLYRVLRAISGVGLVMEHEDRKFTLTMDGKVLCKGGHFRNDVLLNLGGEQCLPWLSIDYSISTGKPAFEKVYQKGIWQYYQENPEREQLFNDAMKSISER